MFSALFSPHLLIVVFNFSLSLSPENLLLSLLSVKKQTGGGKEGKESRVSNTMLGMCGSPSSLSHQQQHLSRNHDDHLTGPKIMKRTSSWVGWWWENWSLRELVTYTIRQGERKSHTDTKIPHVSLTDTDVCYGHLRQGIPPPPLSFPSPLH